MAPKHKYTILSMMKDEGHSLVEWVAFHNHIGFDNICVYTNNCGDGTDDMLIRLQELGWCKHFRNDVPEGKKPQPNALALATQNEEVMDSEWILTMDADEFLSIKCGKGRISDLVERIPEEAQAMAITWRFFGSSGITDWNPGLVSEMYTQAAPDKFKKGWGVKTLFRPYPNVKLGIHRPHVKNAKQKPDRAKMLYDQVWVNGSGERMPDEFSLSGWRSTKPTLGYKLVELNHYAVKSYEAYLLRRVRGNVNNKPDKYNEAYFALFDRNELEVTNVHRHLRGVKKKMERILEDPIMRELQDKALEFHANRVKVLHSSGEYEKWVDELKKASEVPLDKLDEVLFIQHLPKVWQEKVKELQAQGVPDKTIAKMIAQTQTAKKGETRAALKQAAGAGEPVKEDTETAEKREAKTEKAMTLDDNPFMEGPEGAQLGVPLLKQSVARMKASAAKADQSDDSTPKDAPTPEN
ncbi:glycosyltransferase family 2 protein [Marivivens niveibacter]|nr:glycosyltransferase family 2 protein [Marivivens niveibacter]